MKATRAQVKTATAVEDLAERLARIEAKLDQVLAMYAAQKSAARSRADKSD